MMRLASGIYDLMIMLLFNSPLHSNSGSYACFRRELVRDMPWYRNDHRYIPLVVMRRGSAERVAEIIVRHRKRRFGRSKYEPWKKLVLGVPEVLRVLVRLKRGRYDLPPPPDPGAQRSTHA
jgi:dolichol-phosphate mannosyltransferase